MLVNGDLLDEANETFASTSRMPSNATIADGQGVGTITDDDAPAGAVDQRRDRHRGQRRDRQRDLHASRLDAAERPERSPSTTRPPTARRSAPGDYQAATGTLTFAAGPDTQTVTVLVNGDMLDEANETFFVNLSNPAQRDDRRRHRASGTIIDDDAPPALSINDVTVTEGNERDDRTPTFTVTLSAASGHDRHRRLRDRRRHGHRAGATTPPPRARVTFARGQTTQTITVPVDGDLLDEINETFIVNLSNADQRDDRRRHGPGHDHRRRRDRRRSRSTTSR